MRLLAFILLSFLAGCAARQQVPVVPGPECNELFVLLPDNYIIDLEAGSEIFLNAGVHEFIVYCGKEEAAKIREKALQKGHLPSSTRWIIYKLEGKPQENAEACHDTAFCLKGSVRVVDWVWESEQK